MERSDTQPARHLAAILACACLCARLVVLVAADPMYDDALITWRVARHLATGHGPVFNLGERAQAATSSAHVLLCSALFALLGEPARWVDRLLACLIDASSVYTVAALMIRAGAGSAALGAAVFTVYYALSVHTAYVIPGGLETAMYLACAVQAFDGVARGRTLRAGLWSGACALTRPEGILAVVAATLACRTPRRAAQIAGLAMLVWLPATAAAALYYGSWLPQSVVAKAQLQHAPWREWRYVLRAFGWGAGQPILAGFAALGAARLRSAPGTTAFVLWGALYTAGIASFTSFWPWYTAPSALVFALCLGLGAASAHAALARSSGDRVAREAGIVALVALAAQLAWFAHFDFATVGPRRAASRAQDLRIARYLEAHTAADAHITSERLGALAYATRRSFDDYPGLASRRVTDALATLGRPIGFGPTDTGALDALLRLVKPTVLVLRDHERAAAQQAGVLTDYTVAARFEADAAVHASSAEHTAMWVLTRRDAP